MAERKKQTIAENGVVDDPNGEIAELLNEVSMWSRDEVATDEEAEQRIAVAKTSRTMLNSRGESGHPCLVPDFRGNAFNFSPLIMFAVGVSYITFIMLRYVPSTPAFWRVFIINGC